MNATAAWAPAFRPGSLTSIGLYDAVGHRTAWPTPPHEEVRYVAGLENPGEAARNVTAWLLNRGWAEPDIARVIGGNVLRVLRSTAAAAQPDITTERTKPGARSSTEAPDRGPERNS